MEEGGKVSEEVVEPDPSSPGPGNEEFELTAEMMVNDFDDERTLEEEEALEETEEQQSELSNLEKEKDMPLERLLAMYGCYEGAENEAVEEESDASASRDAVEQHSTSITQEKEEGGGGGGEVSDEKEKEIESGAKLEEEEEEPICETSTTVPTSEIIENEQIVGDEGGGGGGENAGEGGVSESNEGILNLEEGEEGEAVSLLSELYKDDPSVVGPRNLRSGSRQHSEEDEDEEEDDGDYSPEEEDWKKVKTIMVGGEYQAVIPESLRRYDDALPYENEDKLLWDPDSVPPPSLSSYLASIYTQFDPHSPSLPILSLPIGAHVRDDEQALYLLLQCGNNFDEALRRRNINNQASSCPTSLWSEEECRNFENGLRQYGKDFLLIHQNRVRSRTVRELVQFYYLWKKTERHDVFVLKTRMEKKKYIHHPGTTDFMERFLDDQDSSTSTLSSPNVHSLLSNDPKRSRTPPPVHVSTPSSPPHTPPPSSNTTNTTSNTPNITISNTPTTTSNTTDITSNTPTTTSDTTTITSNTTNTTSNTSNTPSNTTGITSNTSNTTSNSTNSPTTSNSTTSTNALPYDDSPSSNIITNTTPSNSPQKMDNSSSNSPLKISISSSNTTTSNSPLKINSSPSNAPSTTSNSPAKINNIISTTSPLKINTISSNTPPPSASSPSNTSNSSSNVTSCSSNVSNSCSNVTRSPTSNSRYEMRISPSVSATVTINSRGEGGCSIETTGSSSSSSGTRTARESTPKSPSTF